jgi:GNAT superfamily N-acetyltransferase
MPSADFIIASEVERTPRVLQLEGIFDVPPAERSEIAFSASLPIEDRPWNIGLIVGPSGSGKSTVAKRLFGEYLIPNYKWSATKSIVDSFPLTTGIADITGMLSSVGFSSPPSWVRPFHALSTGEQFRVTMARAMYEDSELIVADEFTSVVDRTVAQIGSAAIAKQVRRQRKKFIAVTCHFDVEAWLQPDWIYRPDLNEFHWRELQRRPEIRLEIFRVHHSAWQLFRKHHYLDTSLNKSAHCFVAERDGAPVAFSAWIARFGRGIHGASKREHRTVTLPDFQGVGIGNRVSEFCASLYRALGATAFSTTSHPGMIRYRYASPLWRMTRVPGMVTGTDKNIPMSRSKLRMTAGFEYVGPGAEPALAESLISA